MNENKVKELKVKKGETVSKPWLKGKLQLTGYRGQGPGRAEGQRTDDGRQMTVVEANLVFARTGKE